MLERYRDRNFVILALNVVEDQNAFVLPLFDTKGYQFIPLKSSWKWAEENFGVKGTPANFLIDDRGRIMFKPEPAHDVRNREALAQQVEALLQRARQPSPSGARD